MVNSIHIELTSRCTLACPACPRTWFNKSFNKNFPKFDLDNNKLIKFLDCVDGQNVTNFHLEGNHGDTIYHPRLFQFIDYWRDTKTFTIVTNGSHRNSSWWKKLSSRLTSKDKVIFSIDGNEQTNHLYRINSEWESIMTGLKEITQSPAYVIWKTILFKTNENQIEEIKNIALNLGASEFVLELSHRFGDDDQYKPIKFVSVDKNLKEKINPKCKDNNTLYISADGVLAPCCWVVTYHSFFSTEFWKNKSQWTIDNTNLTEFNFRQTLNNFVKSTEDNYNNAYTVCKHNCNINTGSIKHYEQRIYK